MAVDAHEVIWRVSASEEYPLIIEAECSCNGFWLYPNLGMAALIGAVADHQGMTIPEAKAKLRQLVERKIWGPLVELLDWPTP